MGNGRTRSRAGVYAAIGAIATTAGLGVVGAAGASSAADEYTIAAGATADTVWHPPEVMIQPGDTVKWTFQEGGVHNVQSSSSNWDFRPSESDPTTGEVSYTFTTEGRYDFLCGFHAGMDGTVIVGDGTPPPPPPPPPPPASPPPSGDDHIVTPAPSAGDDTVEPTVRSVSLKALRRAVRVRFRLSEPATVTLRVKRRGSRKVLKSARVQAPAGTRTLTLRSRRLKKGRYTVEIQARDAFGNRSSLARKRLALRR